jgi:alpha-beta hydrolase superfamily lysophospholipase
MSAGPFTSLEQNMRSSTFALRANDGVVLFVYRWLPGAPPKAVVQIAHGLAEHAGRYTRLAKALTRAGYAVFAGDHRGHGRTARTAADLGFFGAQDGWHNCLNDLRHLNNHIAAEYPGVPIVLLGHSMGSFMAQQFISEHGETIAAVILAGSAGRPPAMARLARVVAQLERFRLGPRHTSPGLNALTFGAFNKHFAPARTDFDWLSRDEAEVDKYVADPLCAFPLSVQLTIDVLTATADMTSPSRQARIPKRLPIHIIAGSRDPVSADTKTLKQLLYAYESVSLERVTHRFYPDARHELFNEINREEVTRDVLAWLDGIIG